MLTQIRYSCGALLVACVLGSAAVQAAVIPSPSTDILLSSNGGVADINGSTTDGSRNYQGLPPANLNDGDRNGVYGNGQGVDAQGSIAHTSNNVAINEMGVTIPTATLIDSVNVFNRTDCCADRIDGNGNVPFTLDVFNGATDVFSQSYTFSPTAAISQTDASGMAISIPANTIGNYVRIVQNNNNYMNLAELEAFTTSTPEPASLGILGIGALGLLIRRR